MLSLSKYGTIFRQFGTNFRVCFSHTSSYVFVAGKKDELLASPVYAELQKTGAKLVAMTGCEGRGLYFQIEAI